jgi:hypothetical protein
VLSRGIWEYCSRCPSRVRALVVLEDRNLRSALAIADERGILLVALEREDEMSMKVMGGVILAAALLQSGAVYAQTWSPQCPVAGTYSVSGTNPGSTVLYHGQASVTSNGVGCYMKWAPPNNSEGSGDYTNGVLTIHFKLGNYTGVVQYTSAAGGQMNGVWWADSNPGARGTETLFPISLAPH